MHSQEKREWSVNAEQLQAALDQRAGRQLRRCMIMARNLAVLLIVAAEPQWGPWVWQWLAGKLR